MCYFEAIYHNKREIGSFQNHLLPIAARKSSSRRRSGSNWPQDSTWQQQKPPGSCCPCALLSRDAAQRLVAATSADTNWFYVQFV
jgi:hypothetical protein